MVKMVKVVDGLHSFRCLACTSRGEDGEVVKSCLREHYASSESYSSKTNLSCAHLHGPNLQYSLKFDTLRLYQLSYRHGAFHILPEVQDLNQFAVAYQVQWKRSRMSALFNFQSLLTVIVLFICTCSYLRPRFGSTYINPKRPGFWGVTGKAAVIGDRLSPWVSAACLIMAGSTLFVR